VTVPLSSDEAVVLFELLHRWEDAGWYAHSSFVEASRATSVIARFCDATTVSVWPTLMLAMPATTSADGARPSTAGPDHCRRQDR
jgi:hypothetical protein